MFVDMIKPTDIASSVITQSLHLAHVTSGCPAVVMGAHLSVDSTPPLQRFGSEHARYLMSAEGVQPSCLQCSCGPQSQTVYIFSVLTGITLPVFSHSLSFRMR